MSTPPAPDTFDDLFPAPPATGLTDADLRALWATVADDSWPSAWDVLTAEECRAYLSAFFRSARPDEDDDGPTDQVQ